MKDRKYLHFANLENSHIAYLCLNLLFIKPELVLCKLCQRHLLREIGDCKPLKQGLLVQGDVGGIIVLILRVIGRNLARCYHFLPQLHFLNLFNRLFFFLFNLGATSWSMRALRGHHIRIKGLLNQNIIQCAVCSFLMLLAPVALPAILVITHAVFI